MKFKKDEIVKVINTNRIGTITGKISNKGNRIFYQIFESWSKENDIESYRFHSQMGLEDPFKRTIKVIRISNFL